MMKPSPELTEKRLLVPGRAVSFQFADDTVFSCQIKDSFGGKRQRRYSTPLSPQTAAHGPGQYYDAD